MRKEIITTEENNSAVGGRECPYDPRRYAAHLQLNQDAVPSYGNVVEVCLHNKGRYFTTLIMDPTLRARIALSIQGRVEAGGYIVDHWRKLQAFTAAMNRKGYFVRIRVCP